MKTNKTLLKGKIIILFIIVFNIKFIEIKINYNLLKNIFINKLYLNI